MKIDKVFWGAIGSVILLMIIPFSLFGFYLYWVPHIPEHISEEIGFLDTINVGLINLILYILVAIKLIKPNSMTVKMFLMSIIPLAFLSIYLIEYKHFLIYYKNFAYKIIFLKEGKEFWTWKKDWEYILDKYSIKFINIPDKYKNSNMNELITLISKGNIRVKCNLRKKNKIFEEDICFTEDGLQYIQGRVKAEIQEDMINNPDECYIKITNVKGNEYYELCKKRELYFLKLIKKRRYGSYSMWNNIVYSKDKIIKELREFVSK